MYETFSYLKEFFEKIFENFITFPFAIHSYVVFITFVTMLNQKVIVSVSSDLVTDNRVHRACSVLHDLGMDVLLIGRKKKSSPALNNRNYQTKRLNLIFEKGPFFYAELNIRLFFILLFKRKALLYANDLDTLLPNFLVSKLSGTKIIYDSHELFTESPELVHRKRTQRIWLSIEKMIFPKLTHIITVNDSIAQAYKNRYQKDLLVIRNIPTKYHSGKHLSKVKLNIPENSFLIIIQGSGLNVERGIEEAVLAMKQLDNVTLMLVGDGDVMPVVKELIQIHSLEDKVKIFGRRPYEEMMQFTMHADLGLTLDKPLSKNYEFSLPNKVFDYMHAGTPILASKLVEIERVIRTHKIGTILSEVSPDAIAAAINELKSKPELLKQQTEACRLASEIENWENERLKLELLIRTVLTNYSL
jgi:glycosyltransferase involved in cell wall biosynthesis